MTDKSDKLHPATRTGLTGQAKKELQSIIGRIEKLGLTSRAIRLSRANSQLRATRFRITLKHLWLIVITLFFAHSWTTKYFAAARYDKCLLALPSTIQKTFRPAEDCSMCSGIQQVDKVSNINPEQFEKRYAYSGRPVVVTDAMNNWTALDKFSFSFFKSLYGGQTADCQFFPYKTEFRNLQEVFNMSNSRALLQRGTKPWYIGWSNCDDKIGTILRQHYHRPYFLPTTAESEKTDWIFMGSTGHGAHMHVDDVEHPSWQAQLSGKKLWTLEPPRECHYTCLRMEVTVLPGEINNFQLRYSAHRKSSLSKDVLGKASSPACLSIFPHRKITEC